MTTLPEDNIVFLEPQGAPAPIPGFPTRPQDSGAAANRLCLSIAEAAAELRCVRDALVLEAEAMKMAMDALARVSETALTCSRSLLKQQQDLFPPGAIGPLARPLGLAASATLAINASIASSSNTLAEISLRIITAGERFVEASRCATAVAQGPAHPASTPADRPSAS